MTKLHNALMAGLVASVALAAPALAAESVWTAQLVNPSDQSPRCLESRVVKFGFELSGNMLSAGGPTTRKGLFTVKVGEDGMFSADYTSIDRFNLTMSGDVKTRQFVLKNKNSGCTYHVVPIQ